MKETKNNTAVSKGAYVGVVERRLVRNINIKEKRSRREEGGDRGGICLHLTISVQCPCYTMFDSAVAREGLG